jgi:hypothetical protein
LVGINEFTREKDGKNETPIHCGSDNGNEKLLTRLKRGFSFHAFPFIPNRQCWCMAKKRKREREKEEDRKPRPTMIFNFPLCNGKTRLSSAV